MTNADPRSDRNGKVEPAPPEYSRELDAYRSWELAIDALHELNIAELIADHDNRMPENWTPDGEA